MPRRRLGSTLGAVDYVYVAGLVFALNLLPAFGPPTSAVLVALTLNFDLEPVPLIAAGALGAASGRYVLARTTRLARSRLSPARRENLHAAQELVTGNRAKAAAGLGLFALSPVPSGQLFVAAGLLDVRLEPLTVAFFCGRVCSYAIYVLGASAAKESVGDEITAALTSPWGIAFQVAALAALAALLRVDWTHVLERRAARLRSDPVDDPVVAPEERPHPRA
jgi:membrane protein YqaA with SNARE-associated domain